MPETIYVVTSGTYSAYHIVALCSTREKADALLAERNNSEDVLEEYQLDVMDEVNAELARGLKRYDVSMMSEDGSGAEAWNVTFGSLTRGVRFREPYVFAVVAATDKDHAIKIVNERRLQWIAAGEPATEGTDDV